MNPLPLLTATPNFLGVDSVALPILSACFQLGNFRVFFFFPELIACKDNLLEFEA